MKQDQFPDGNTKKMHLHPVSLKFRYSHKHLEKPFLTNYLISSMTVLRFAILFGIVIYSIFGILDAYLIPEKKYIFWFLRFAIFLPAALGILFFSYKADFKMRSQFLLFLLKILAGFLIIIMIVLASPPVSFSYYAGLILVFMFGYTIIRLQFLWASAAGWTLVILYEIFSVFVNPPPLWVLINNNFFFIGANLIGMIACYSIEYNFRRDFYLNYLLENERTKVRQSKDILEEKVKERTAQLLQVQKMDSIGTLAGGVAHDFNNLLTVINGYAEMALQMMKKDETQPMYRMIEPIFESGKKAAELTNQLLAFSRKQVFSPHILDLNIVIKNMNKILLRLINSNIKITTNLTKNMPNILADSTQLEQILINLVINARDAVSDYNYLEKKKWIKIETGTAMLGSDSVRQYPECSAGEFVYLRVADNGTGMDEKTKQNIFEPFYTTKDKSKGTGLGLSTVYGIVTQNRGSISVDSSPGKGTAITIYWPVSDKEDTTKKETAKTDNDLSGTESVLLVEDEPDVRNFAETALLSFGYKVLTAANGRLALKQAKKYRYQFKLIITDLIMPELNGRDFVEILKKIQPDIKIIFISGYTDSQILKNGKLEAGIHFIQKPFSAMVLGNEVRKILDEEKQPDLFIK